MEDDYSWANETVAGAGAGAMFGPVGMAIGGGIGLLGGLLGSRSNRRQVRAQLDAQREFAQHGIQWRVEDAKRAGLHPLYALGASTSGPTLSVMDDPVGRSVAGMGQDISRAAMAGSSDAQREITALQLQVAQLGRDRAFWETATARENARRAIGAGVSAPVVSGPRLVEGQGDSPPVVVSNAGGDPNLLGPEAFGDAVAEARKMQSRSWLNPGYSAGSTPLWDLYQTGPGNHLAMFAGGQPSEQFENLLATLWSISESMDRDPQFLRGSGIPYGVALQEFMDARDKFNKSLLDFIEQYNEVVGGRHRRLQRLRAGDDYRWKDFGWKPPYRGRNFLRRFFD